MCVFLTRSVEPGRRTGLVIVPVVVVSLVAGRIRRGELSPVEVVDARRLERIEDARLIQNSILPRHLPQPGDFEIAARTVAAEIVGGDFYDVISLADDLFVVVVADATGHGLPALVPMEQEDARSQRQPAVNRCL